MRSLARSRIALVAFSVTLTLLVFVALDRVLFVVLRSRTDDNTFRKTLEEHRRDLRARNNVYLLSPHDLPRARDPDEFVIGIFGGSVAANLAGSIEAMPLPQSTKALEARTGRKVRFLNLALHGGSEPVQYNLLHFFHDQIDAAVFVDGFNEMFLHGGGGAADGCEIASMFWANNQIPREQLLSPLVARRKKLAIASEGWWWNALEASGIFRLYLRGLGMRESATPYIFFSSLSLDERSDPPVRSTLSDREDNWEKCTDRSAQYAREVGLPAFFFLQPNQYVAGSKVFTEEEKILCFRDVASDPPALREVYGNMTKIYADLSARIEAMKRRGIVVASWAKIYGSETRSVYEDDCCHVNRQGNEILADAVVRAVLEGAPDRPR